VALPGQRSLLISHFELISSGIDCSPLRKKAINNSHLDWLFEKEAILGQTTFNMSNSVSDEEKAKPFPIPDDEFLVKWDDNDPLNPRNLSALRSWLITMCVSIGALAV
jgi:hypothetical protein